MKFFGTRISALSLILGSWLVATAPARADLTLTSEGLAQGLGLSLVATGFPVRGGVGPLGMAFPTSGGMLVTDNAGNVRLLASNVDGQNAAISPVIRNFGEGNAIALATVDGRIYMTQNTNGALVELNNNGTFKQTIVTGMPIAVGMAVNPANGHLFVAANGSGTIYDVDPIAKTKTVFASLPADGLSISPDGKTLYAAAYNSNLNGHVLGFDVATKALVFDSGLVASGVDGTAAGTGLFSGQLFANTNFGQVYQIDLNTKATKLIATGGSRGDFVTVDPFSNTLLITQTDRIYRLTGASFTSVPEPSPLLMGSLLGLAGAGWRALRRCPSRTEPARG